MSIVFHSFVGDSINLCSDSPPLGGGGVFGGGGWEVGVFFFFLGGGCVGFLGGGLGVGGFLSQMDSISRFFPDIHVLLT